MCIRDRPQGVPVATVAINGAANAAILAIQMLAITNTELQNKLKQSKEDMIAGVIKKDKALQEKLKDI